MHISSHSNAHIPLLHLTTVLCGGVILASSYLSVTHVFSKLQPPPDSDFTGVVRSEPSATEVKTTTAGRLVTIAVREGSVVKAGAVIARIEPAERLSDLEALRLELATFSMQKAALAAEKAGDTEVAFKPSDLPQDTWSASAAETLGELQKSHRELIGSELKVQQIRRDAELRQIERLKRKSEIQTIIRGKCAEQLTSLIAQRKRISDLVARGVFPLNRDAELERQIMAVELRVAEADAQIADVESEKEMARLAAADRARSRLEDIVSRERDLAVKVTDVRNHIANVQTRLANADVHAPHDGVVRNVRFAVPGAKVTEGDILFDVERTNQTYLVEVVAPAAVLPPIEAGDGAQVKPGMRNVASVRSIRAVIDGITDGDDDVGAVKGSIRTVYVAVAEDSVPLDERNKFRTGSSVRVTIDAGTAVAGADPHSARHKPARG